MVQLWRCIKTLLFISGETSMHTRLRAMVVLALAFCLASPIAGQPPGGRGEFGGGRGMMGGPGMLLQNSGVQKELKLSDEQIQKVKETNEKIRDKHNDEFEALRKLDVQEVREK